MPQRPTAWIRGFWEGWKGFARVIGNFNSRVFLTLFYFVVVGVVSLLVGRWKDTLRKRLPPQTNWLPVASKGMDLDGAKRQF